ncbi:hypothetical protein KIPB_012239 [Kipferlia bialata]|uniref:Uncharacterized protein n=1 Tax=Kipferlia bialata TaxID=797122 RepID=A0A391P055_9EUKA|nr:hypothetical protein KIPB_012239 [Kipferlia bialata]|eukprot:g12239.t1
MAEWQHASDRQMMDGKLHIAFEQADLQNDTAWFERHFQYEPVRMFLLKHRQGTCFRWENFSRWFARSRYC